MKAEDVQYSISDLSRALLREFLSQKGLKKTLQAFEKEDLRNKKKINKNLLIEMLSLKSLFLLNKQARDAKTSLLQILVTYLNKKYQIKKNNFVTTQPNASFSKLEDALQTQKVQGSYKNKERPSSSKPFKSYELESVKQHAGPIREKEELKVIYQKLSKKQEAKQFRIVESNALKKEPSKISQKAAHLEEQPSTQPFKNKVLQIQDEYQQEFEEPEVKQPAVVTKTQVKSAQKVNIDSNKYKPVSNFSETPIQLIQEISKQHIEKSKPSSEPKGTFNQIIQKQQRTTDKKITETKQKDVKSEQPIEKMLKSNSQQNINPTPILHIQSKPLQLQKKEVKNMGSSASVSKKEECIVEEPKQQPQKLRTEMRLVGKKRQPSSKDIQVLEEKKQIAKQPVKEQPKKQVQIIQQQKLAQIPKQDAGSKKQFEVNKKMETAPNNAAPVMVTLGKKRKGKQQVSETSYPTKFKFDENFTHEIPKELTYQYKQYRFDPITIIQNASQLYPDLIVNTTINYKQKGGGVPPIKKKLQKIIASKDAQRLKKIVFQSSPAVLPKSWAQGFILSPHEQTPYGLKQIQGGPCGIIAAMQCYFLKHLLFCSGQSEYNDETLRQMCLAAAITDMLWKVKSTDKFYLAFPPKGASKVEINNLRTTIIDANDFFSAFAGIWSVRDQYIGNTNHGVAALLYSVVLTKGIELIEDEMDIKENPLIGNHGHCTQQFVNLVLTGKASSNCFDGQKILDDYKLKGIPNKSQFGFLTIFEALKYLQVGKNLKNPIFPVWVICKQFHYHVIFASHYLISECNKASKLDIVYYDGLYNCGDRIRITLQSLKQDQEDNVKLKDLPLIEQVMMTKWGRRIANWNGSTRIL